MLSGLQMIRLQPKTVEVSSMLLLCVSFMFASKTLFICIVCGSRGINTRANYLRRLSDLDDWGITDALFAYLNKLGLGAHHTLSIALRITIIM